jgi:hypothetical protein
MQLQLICFCPFSPEIIGTGFDEKERIPSNRDKTQKSFSAQTRTLARFCVAPRAYKTSVLFIAMVYFKSVSS